MRVVTGDQIREIERIAIHDTGIPSIILMENAAIRLTKHCIEAVSNIKNANILIICGSGSNGGDGMALARHLHVKGIKIKIIYAGDVDKKTVKNDVAINLGIVRKLGIPIMQAQQNDNLSEIKSAVENSDLTVDALLGTGLDRNVDGIYKTLIEMINNYAKYIISVDIPSGVHSDTGRIMGCAVKATQTVTFCLPKIGLYAFPGAEYAGKIHIEDISISDSIKNRIKIDAEILTNDEAKRLLPVRAARSNKGSFGRIAILAGSNEMPGAAALTCSAAYASGGGLVCAYVTQNTAAVINQWQREVITLIVPEKNGMYCKDSLEAIKDDLNRSSVIAIGPGIGRSPDVTEFVHELLKTTEAPVVMDADALFAVSGNTGILKTLKAPCVITPHPGEMSRLTGVDAAEVLDNIIDAAVNFSKKHNVITLLKDAHTVIASPIGRFNINTTGSNALSKAGTGDVLTGIIAGFIAQGLDVYTAGILGAYFHGKAGEAAGLKKLNYCVSASDIIEYLSDAMTENP
ncbi:MAG: NAD(P)H-hydrate dehydratase [Treponema sp.]|nr:NAD(P)H-hydrate dehydratase [Treponema sp.]MCL2273074.1 NAD(P)H-hydrate dehydratase [Treponema sp.]